MNKLLIAAGVASLLGAGIAVAQTPANPPANGAAGWQGRHADETRADLKARVDERFDRMDVNHDGKIDAADRGAMVAERFKRLDTDGNGSLSLAEYQAGMEMRGDHGGPGGHRGGHGGPDGAGGPGGHGRFSHGKMGMDGGPGPVTKADFESKALSRFDQADTNHDGVLSAAERQAARAAFRSRAAQ